MEVAAIALVAGAARELALFAAVGFVIGGIDDLAVDLIWIARSAWRRLTVYRLNSRATAATLRPGLRGRIAVFVPAWREEAVIGFMIEAACRTFRHPDWRLYVGCYPNDPGTILAVAEAAGRDARVRLVVGDAPGPTTKAGCLNWLWHAMREDEDSERRYVKAVVLHDAEDVVHEDELAVYDSLIDRFDLVQLPVEPVSVRGRGAWRAFVSSHYASEFAEAHAKQLVVREAIGAAVPSAGVGCAIARPVLSRMAAAGDGPFDAQTVTEDYEAGLRIGAAGGRGVLVRIPASDGDGMVAIRACFPDGIRTSARQKARWITGIAFTGWDRLGWSGNVAERWMRLRDRRAPLAALVVLAGWSAILLWAAATWLAFAHGREIAIAMPELPMRIALVLLVWRLVVRAAFVWRIAGWRMAALTPLHLIVGNVVAILAVAQAIATYVGFLRTGRLHWDKTAHVFPSAA